MAASTQCPTVSLSAVQLWSEHDYILEGRETPPAPTSTREHAPRNGYAKECTCHAGLAHMCASAAKRRAATLRHLDRFAKEMSLFDDDPDPMQMSDLVCRR